MGEQALQKIVLITGANKGIGFEVARQLAGGGATVLLGARDRARGEAAAAKLRAAGLDARALVLDVTAPETVAAAAGTIESEFGRLDVLVNNAGVAELDGDGPPSAANPETVERTMRTNFFGAAAVAKAMLPLLRKSPAGRIVNVSSGLGSLAQNGDPDWPYAAVKALGYNASKAALNMLTVQLAYELRNTPIKVNSADPGYTATDLNGNRGTQTVEEGSEAIVRLAQLPENGPSGGYFSRHGSVPW